MKLSDYVARYLKDLGIGCVFGYQGGNIAHVIDSIEKTEGIQFVTSYNEQGAAFAACGYAYASEGIGAAAASSGPGAINLISGIANAYYDSIPCIFITGNVSLESMKKCPDIRQEAFQENDIVTMVRQVVKYAVTVEKPERIKYHLDKAAFLAQNGRPGPVLLDLPHNVQRAEIEPAKLPGYAPQTAASNGIAPDQIKAALSCLRKACRPLIIAGGGAANRNTRAALEKFLCKWPIPTVSTLRGMDVLSHESKCFCGFAGAYGNRHANLAVKYSDVILVLGARLDERLIAVKDKANFEKKIVVHVDVDEHELGHILTEEISIHGAAEDFLTLAAELTGTEPDSSQWLHTVKQWSRRYPSVGLNGMSRVHDIVRTFTKGAPEDALFCVDIGICQMCAAQSASLGKNQRMLTSAGHGAMGFALPAAIGCAYGAKPASVMCFVGDGAFHMNIQEMLMLSRDGLPVHVVLFNNECLGMIRDYQEKVFSSRFSATVREFQGIDYKALAAAYGADYVQVRTIAQAEAACRVFSAERPSLIEVVLDEDTNAFPMLGDDMFHQKPPLTSEELETIELEAKSCGNTISW